MVEDTNNFDEAREAIEEGMAAGLSELHSEVLATVIKNMTAGKDALGNPWPLVEESTLASRQTRTNNRSPLVDIGEYRADIVASSDVNTEELVAFIGTTKAFAKHHEFGAPEAGIPARPLYGPAGKYGEDLAPELIGEEIDARLENADVD